MPVAKPNNGIAQFSSVHLSISFVCSLSYIEQDKEKENIQKQRYGVNQCPLLLSEYRYLDNFVG